MSPSPSLTGPALRQYRRALGLKQGELGDELGVSQAAISLVEAGRMAVSESLRDALVERFDREGESPRLSEFLAELGQETPPRSTLQAHTTLPVYRWTPKFDPLEEPVDRQVDLVTLRCSAPAVALAMSSASTAWEQEEILVFAVCEPSNCKPGDLVLLQPTNRPRHAASLIAGVERVKGRSSAHRRLLPIQPSTQALSADADSVAFIARCVYRARYMPGIDR